MDCSDWVQGGRWRTMSGIYRFPREAPTPVNAVVVRLGLGTDGDLGLGWDVGAR